MTGIRKASVNDIPAVLAMAERFYGATMFPRWMPFDGGTVARLAAALAEDHVLLLAEDEGRVVGMAGLFILPFMFNANHISAHEVVWWVEPEAQGKGAGKALLQAIEPACRERGAELIYMVHLANSPPQAAAAYERLGYEHGESSYVKAIPRAA